MTSATTGQKRITQLDGLRACAILAVFARHAFNARMLWIGVDVFFVLSGFLITGILLDLKHMDLKGYFAQFYRRRARRILPPYVMLLLVVTMVFGTAWMKRWYMYAGMTNYVALFRDSPGFEQFNPLWSLGVEEQFYLLWPFAIYFLSEKKLPWVAGGLVVLAPIFRVLAVPYDYTHQMVYMGTPFRMDCLAMGSLITFLWRSKPDAIRKYGYLGLVAVVLTPVVMMKLGKLGGFSTFEGTWRSNFFTYEIALCCATGAFLWGLGGRYVWLLNTPPFQFLGRISYTFYLIFQSMLMLFERHFTSRAMIGALGFAASVAYATLSWYFYEMPILAGGNRKVAALEVESAGTEESAQRARTTKLLTGESR